VTPVCVNCSVVVSILAMGVQNDGRVSKRVGRELVKSGFMYLKINFTHKIKFHFLLT
jgi:hypothetical protein